jgi:hypothetical protein
MNGFQESHNSPDIHELLTLETRPNGVVSNPFDCLIL